MRTVLIDGRVPMTTYALGQAMDDAFDQQYAAFFENSFKLSDEFKTASLKYFDDYANSPHAPAAHDHYFYCFTVIWNALRSAGRLEEAERIWKLAHEPAQEWEQAHPGQAVDKGALYYFWAMTALLRGSMDRGYVLMHQSVQEDSRTSGQPNPDTPSFALVSLNDDKTDQAFRQWVIDQAKFFEVFVGDYCTTYGRPFKIEDMKLKFLRNPPSADAVFQLTHAVARLREIAGLPEQSKRNSFVGQIQLNLLFDILLVVDNAIHQKNPTKWKFSDHARYLLDRAGHGLKLNELQKEVHGQFKANFNAALKAALNGTFTIRAGVLDRLQCDVAVAYGLRNRGAHEIEAVPAIWKELDQVQRAVFRTFCATVDYLY
jgi:hypothetical protein